MLLLLLTLGALTCDSYLIPWQGDVPLKEMLEAYEEKSSIKKMYDAEMFKDILQSQASEMEKLSGGKFEFSINGGQNCGKAGTSETIYVNSLSIPDVLVLGANATFSGAVTVNALKKTATLLSVVIRKVGLPFNLPCTQDVGSCNYTNPCQLLEKIQCPKQIVAAGWNCRCPIPVKHYSLAPFTVLLPTIPLPAFLVDGTYDATARLFDGPEELLCYHLTVTVKEKQ